MVVSRLAIGLVAAVFAVGALAQNAAAAKAKTRSFSGLASYYSERERLSTGGRYNPNELTAAHRTLPFGTRVRVTDPKTGRSVIATINDRGPFRRGRVIDVSVSAARALGMINRGVIYVRAEVL